ncbi:MAG: mannitol dehydrogenase family protein [Caldimonas sp.]
MVQPRALSEAALPHLPPSVRVPGYRRRHRAPCVVHLGLGAFHRAHQATVFDALLRAGDDRWGVFGVAMRSPALADALNAQDGLYSVRVEGGDAPWQVVGSVWSACVAANDPAVVHGAIAAATTRWLTLTVTEKGYGPALAATIVHGLAERHRAARPGLTVASCDNLSGNGTLLKALCMDAAADPALRAWIDATCAFPNSMVDRIVPAATDRLRQQAHEALGVRDEAAIASEPFCEWVLQDHFAEPGDAAVLRCAGVTVVDDVRPFEEAKLRLLNASHTAIACIGVVHGLRTVRECMARPAIAAFVHGLMTQEVMPHLHRPNLPAYRDALLARFESPAIEHKVQQIATDSSKKIPQRWVPSVLDRLRCGAALDHLSFAAAAWMRWCTGVNDDGQTYALIDPMSKQLQAASADHSLLDLDAIWGPELTANAVWRGAVEQSLARIRQHGLARALDEFVAGRALDAERR